MCCSLCAPRAHADSDNVKVFLNIAKPAAENVPADPANADDDGGDKTTTTTTATATAAQVHPAHTLNTSVLFCGPELCRLCRSEIEKPDIPRLPGDTSSRAC